MKERLILQKIPLEALLELLEELYDKGAEFVDIIGSADNVQDQITVIVKQEYINKEENGFDIPGPPLTEQDLLNLI